MFTEETVATKICSLKDQEKQVSKKVGRAIADYGLIEDGDMILVGVSGGKDSLVLFKILAERLSFVPIKYELIPVYVDLGYQSVDTIELSRYFAGLGFELIVKKSDILKDNSDIDLTCFWCSWNRRKVLFETALRLGCNKLAFGHHKDDIVQTILMNLLFEGQISAMGPKQEMFKGKLFIIRPLAYVEEKETEELSKFFRLPVSSCICPAAQFSKRMLVKNFINELQQVCPSVKTNIFKSLQRIKQDYLL